MASRKFGWHSGTLTCQDIKARGDVYVQDDIIFSDVSAGVLGVTGGIDMQSTTSAIGIDMGGTHSTAAINIDGTSAIGILIANANVTTGFSITGATTTAISLTGDATTGIDITSGMSATNVISIAATASTAGINISGDCTTGITIGAQTTDGIAITGVAVNGIHITGAMTTAGILIAYTLPAQPDHAIEVITSSGSTDASNSVRPIHMVNTMTGAGGVGGRAEFEMTTNVALGGWSNAIKGFANYGASGKTSGLGSAVLAEMSLSAGTTDGNYAPLEIELNVPSGASLGTKTTFQYMSVNGADASTFDSGGYVLNLQGLSEGTGNVFSAGADVAAAATLRILVGATDYYLLLATGESN